MEKSAKQKIYMDMAPLVLLLFNIFVAINAFNPISLPTSSSNVSATHESITRCAVATITSEYIQTHYGINLTIPNITNGICPSSFFSQIKNAFSEIKKMGGNTCASWEITLDYIVARNAEVDLTEQTDTSRHFDSESFIPASQVILQRYGIATQALKSCDYENANEYFGKALHTLQGIY